MPEISIGKKSPNIFCNSNFKKLIN